MRPEGFCHVGNAARAKEWVERQEPKLTVLDAAIAEALTPRRGRLGKRVGLPSEVEWAIQTTASDFHEAMH
jgi:hypothetical protein